MASAHARIETSAKEDKFRRMRIRLAARISRVHKRTKSAEGHSLMR